MASDTTRDCVVIGGGPVGLAATALLSAAGIDVTLVAPVAKPPAASTVGRSGDTRTAALFTASITLLRNLGVWPTLEANVEALRAIRIVDASGTLLRAPELMLPASEIGLPEFGFNVPQDILAAGLWQTLRTASMIDATAVAVETSVERARITLSNGARITARLVVAADGRDSICRTAAGIGCRRWTYPQTAIATRFRHGRPHHGISTELHTPSGPCTTVPLPDRWSSLVWVERPDEAERLGTLGDGEFIAALERRLGGLLGALAEPGPRRTFKLSGLAAETLGRNRVALIGESGHVIPPIGAQGLNLGLMDVAVLADRVVEARRRDEDIGGPAVLDTYNTARKSDIGQRMDAVDLLNRMLISSLLPLSLARGLGLHVIAASAPLRRRLMREGMQPSGPLPTAMRAQIERQAG